MFSVSFLYKKIIDIPCSLFLLFVVSILFTGCLNKASDKNELDGIYKATSHDAAVRQFIMQEDTYLKLDNDSILYHSTINSQPKYHIKGSYTTQDYKTLTIIWETGKLPTELHVKDTTDGKFIQIGNTLYIK